MRFIKPICEYFFFSSTVWKQNWRRPLPGESSPDVCVSGLPKRGYPDHHWRIAPGLPKSRDSSGELSIFLSNSPIHFDKICGSLSAKCNLIQIFSFILPLGVQGNLGRPRPGKMAWRSIGPVRTEMKEIDDEFFVPVELFSISCKILYFVIKCGTKWICVKSLTIPFTQIDSMNSLGVNWTSGDMLQDHRQLWWMHLHPMSHKSSHNWGVSIE